MKEYVFESTIYSSEIGKGGAYVIFPYDLRAEWNKGRLKVQATFDCGDYQGSCETYYGMNKLAIMSMKKKEHRYKIFLRISIDQG